MDNMHRDDFIQWITVTADQIRDLIEAYDMDDITRDEFIRTMTVIMRDFHAAHTEARMIKPDDDHD